MSTPYATEFVGWGMVLSAVLVIIFALVVTAPVRRFLQGCLGGVCAKSRDSSAAAVVQTMVSGDAITEVRAAHERLYCIRLSALREADMANNQDSGLFAKTEKSSSGECDAFLSHSWRDNPELKWKRMLEFKTDFESKHNGDEPKCWLDKVNAATGGGAPTPALAWLTRSLALGPLLTRALWIRVRRRASTRRETSTPA